MSGFAANASGQQGARARVEPRPSAPALQESLWQRVEPLLLQVEKPARYIGSELNAASSVPGAIGGDDVAPVSVAFVYPDAYEVGASNQAIAILYDKARALPGVRAERACLPWYDMIKLMREHDIPMFTLESFLPLASFDVIAITIPHELSYTNILELLDLAGVSLRSSERAEGDPLVIGGGPCAFNPEPLAPFFDALLLGEGEDAVADIVDALRAARVKGASRAETLGLLGAVSGMYVPSHYEAAVPGGTPLPTAPDVPACVDKRLMRDFSRSAPPTLPLVPYMEVVHDRLAVEILRGCARGCRFCQAGMTYRPVRERPADTVVRAVFDGIACTGFGEVSLTSLSSTDHSQITEMLRRLALGLRDTGVSLSLPSQRLDAFGVAMAQLIASGERKTGLTFAPEAGTQRLRDVINKNVKEADLTEAVRSAFEQGWRRCKLYFMIGLPSERDEDVEGIAHMANRAYATAKEAAGEKDRNNVRLGVSVAVFVPKAHTPFQWCGQIRREEADRRIGLIKAAGLHRGIDLHCHNPASALIEAVMARGDRSLAPLLEAAWRAGASFDAWTERFSLEAWHTAAQQTGIDFAALASRDLPRDAGLPWDHLSTGIDKRYLLEEHERSMAEMTTDDCTYASCTGCGACGSLGAQTELGGGARG